MAPKLFGTDGIRAVAGEYPLEPETIRAVGMSLVRLLERRGLGGAILVGRDTRESGPWMEAALAAGIAAAGGRTESAGVIPTSAISFLTQTHGFAAGAVLSASHNPFRDNGIKLFSPKGHKAPEEWETEIEADILGEPSNGGAAAGPGMTGLPREPVRTSRRLVKDYVDYVRSRVLIPGRRRAARRGRPVRLVIDCANGAASAIAPPLFRSLGFDVVAANDAPDGRNINLECGSLHPEGLARRVVETGANFGIAYDGDADRAVCTDEHGRVLNGDHTLFVNALEMQEAGTLASGCVVATTMTNMGLEKALGAAGIGLVRTRVGDKYVYDEMVARGANLGGERCGHTIFLDDMTTGDGLLTSLKMAAAVVRRGLRMSELVAGYAEFPQVMVNVRVARKSEFSEFPEIVEAVRFVETRLGSDGRLDLRYSGTEPLARIMVEGRDARLVDECAEKVAEAVRRRLGE